MARVATRQLDVTYRKSDRDHFRWPHSSKSTSKCLGFSRHFVRPEQVTGDSEGCQERSSARFIRRKPETGVQSRFVASRTPLPRGAGGSVFSANRDEVIRRLTALKNNYCRTNCRPKGNNVRLDRTRSSRLYSNNLSRRHQDQQRPPRAGFPTIGIYAAEQYWATERHFAAAWRGVKPGHFWG